MSTQHTQLRLWYCTSFQGHWPVGTAALAIAATKEEAAHQIGVELKARGLPGDVDPESIHEMAYDTPKALILLDGSY